MSRGKRHNLELIMAWLDALRRHDLPTLRAGLDPNVVWKGLREELSCQGPDAVIAGFVSARDEHHDIDALELVPAPDHVILAARSADLREIAGIPLAGEIYNVFTIVDDKITRIEDHADRDGALRAAGLSGQPVS
jgi:ketosteroid isomerase-like protein